MKIWLIQTGEDIPVEANRRKLRTAVLAEELASRGHEVVWWAAAFSHLRKKWVTRERKRTLSSGVKVELLHGSGYRTNISLARVIDHRIVTREFKKRSRMLPVPDVIVCALPPYDLAYQVARYAKQHHVPLIIDARDYWPDIFLTAVPGFLRPLVKLGLYSEFRQARFAFRAADKITAMSKDVLDWALSYCGRERSDSDRVFHLGFGQAVRAPGSESASPDWLRRLEGRFIAAFVGTFSPSHSPAILVEAAERLIAAGREDIAIVMAGVGGDLYEDVTAKAKKMPNITLPGWLEKDTISALLDEAAVGICPTSLEMPFFPNKTFLYFSRGLPVLSAFKGELREVLDNDGLGAYFHRNDAEALTNQIIRFCDDKDFYQETRDRVRKTFAERFDERVIYSAFADYVEQHVGSNDVQQLVA